MTGTVPNPKEPGFDVDVWAAAHGHVRLPRESYFRNDVKQALVFGGLEVLDDLVGGMALTAEEQQILEALVSEWKAGRAHAHQD